MFHTPAHKQTDLTKAPGQVRTPVTSTPYYAWAYAQGWDQAGADLAEFNRAFVRETAGKMRREGYRTPYANGYADRSL